MKIENHKLIGEDSEKIEFHQTPNIGDKYKAGNLDTIIIHYTAGRNAKQSIASLCNKDHQASAHLVIGRDNSITQLVDFDTIAWHAGKSSYNGRTGFNQYSIGIEIDNCGYLTKHGDDYLSWFGSAYDKTNVFEGKHRNPNVKYDYWLRYTEWQIETVENICELLIRQYNIKHILGHEEIAPNRKMDPGPAFPLDKLRDRLLNSDRSSDEADDSPSNNVNTPASAYSNIISSVKTGIVNCSSLNIRSSASISASKIAPPLPKGTKLSILNEENDWYYVNEGVLNGWVSKQYVDII